MPPPPNLVISKIGPESDVLLRNLSEHYCHDMSEWFELDTGADGRFSYDTASVWEKGYDAYLAKVGDSIAGFALIGSGGEWLGDIGAHDGAFSTFRTSWASTSTSPKYSPPPTPWSSDWWMKAGSPDCGSITSTGSMTPPSTCTGCAKDCLIASWLSRRYSNRKKPFVRSGPFSGTTGYDFVNALGSAMLNPAGLDRATRAYRQMTGGTASFADVVYQERKRVIEQLFVGEAQALSLHLNLLAESDRYAKDASPQELYSALVEVTACLPVYRTYTRSFQIRPQDLLHIDQAFQEARRRNSELSETIWNFVRRVLLLDCPTSLSAAQRASWKQFVQRWQLFSGPVMAKGKEDTAFYIDSRLISMNEVGGQDQAWSVADFHQFAERRAKC